MEQDETTTKSRSYHVHVLRGKIGGNSISALSSIGALFHYYVVSSTTTTKRETKYRCDDCNEKIMNCLIWSTKGHQRRATKFSTFEKVIGHELV